MKTFYIVSGFCLFVATGCVIESRPSNSTPEAAPSAPASAAAAPSASTSAEPASSASATPAPRGPGIPPPMKAAPQ